MDEQREHQPAPERLNQLPPHVRKWLNGLEPEDIAQFREFRDFMIWFRTSGRYTRRATMFLMGAFGLYTSVIYFWGKLTGKGG